MIALATLLMIAAQPAPAPAPVALTEPGRLALADARALPAGEAPLTRYLYAGHLPAAEREELFKVISYHANAMSRESKLVPPRQVTDWLWAVRLDHYRWDAAVWEKLKANNSYFAVKVQVSAVPGRAAEYKTGRRQVWKDNGYGGKYLDWEDHREITREAVPAVAAKVDFIAAPLVPAELTLLTGSVTPIVRADEFLYQTAIQADRNGHGYYDFLALKKRADAERLARLDRKGSEEIYRELGAIVVTSGVTLQNRQVFRLQALTGGWWETRDCKTSVGKQNAITHLAEDFEHEVEEIIYYLSNGLPGTVLCNKAGDLADTAPDTFASDHRSTNNDRRIHVGTLTCFACHKGGLKPIRDYARKVYSGQTGLSLASLAADAARSRRLESVYLGPLQRNYDRDQADFAAALEEASGLKPEVLAAAVERQWSNYIDRPVTLARAAAELGVTPDDLRTKLREAARAKRLIDPVLATLLLDDGDAVPVRREHWEERFTLAVLLLQGANP